MGLPYLTFWVGGLYEPTSAKATHVAQPNTHPNVTNVVGGVAQLVKTSIYDRRTFPSLRHEVQLTNDLL